MARILFFFAVCFFYQSLFAFSQSFITTGECCGRFGDNLIHYMHTKWISHQYQIPLLHKPFICSSELVLDGRELHYNSEYGSHFEIGSGFETMIFNVPGVFVCPYFPESKLEIERGSTYYFAADWKNPEFRAVLLELIAPIKKLSLFKPPKEAVGIAIHVREGGGVDHPDSRLIDPCKFPILEFYVQALPAILSLFPGKRIYCRLFTDALNPQEIAKTLQEAIPNHLNVKIDYRKENDSSSLNMLEDFFSLFHYDVLVRPESNFSIVPCLLHDFAIVYVPKKFSIKNRTVKFEEIEMEINKELFQKLLSEKLDA